MIPNTQKTKTPPPITNEDLREVIYELFLQGEGEVKTVDVFDYYKEGGYDDDAVSEALDFAFAAG